MGLMDSIKQDAVGNGTKIQSSASAELEKIFNRMFYLDKNVEEETKFVKHVMTRGQESQERVGLHASALIVSDKKFCIRQQVLSLLYKQRQGEQISPGLKRIFEEGNAIHEKWQRLFIRAGYGTANDMDMSRMNEEFEVSYTPDMIAVIPEFMKERVIVEVKSVNTFQFKKQSTHPSGQKQCQLYMWLEKIRHGIVLLEDKNTQDFKTIVETYNPDTVRPFVERMREVQRYKRQVIEEKKMVDRVRDCTSPSCKRSSDCPMRDACWNVGMGRVRI